MRLWEKSKRLGSWDPAEIDFSGDAAQWRGLSPGQRDVLLRLTALFQGGEEAVTLDLLPLIAAVAREGRVEEEMYLAAFLWEEAKHVDAFRRFFEEVAPDAGDLSRYHGPAFRRIFHRELPAALRALEEDPSPSRMAAASTTYNMVVEGVLAETGYHAYHSILERNDLLPGTRRMVARVKRDESRHLAYGVYLLSRLVAERGDPVWGTVESTMASLWEPALGVIQEIFAAYGEMPFGLEMEDFVDFAAGQYRKRMDRIEAARGKDPARIEEEMSG
jgi:ribonucleoside-diphosphate reductase beta chain